MPTGSEVRNTDQKQGNAMSSNLNCGRRRKEKPMNAITTVHEEMSQR